MLARTRHLNFVAQRDTVGAIILTVTLEEKDRTQGLGSRGARDEWSHRKTLVGTFMMTLACFQCAANCSGPLVDGTLRNWSGRVLGSLSLCFH